MRLCGDTLADRAGLIDTAPLITHRYKLEDIERNVTLSSRGVQSL